MHAYRDQYATLFRDGRDVVLIAISTDSPEDLSSWASDDQFQFLMGSDPGAKVGQMYGAFIQRDSGPLDNRTLFVIDPEGRISHVAAPFNQVDPSAYTDLGAAIDEVTPDAGAE
jgi:peroxiredoxin